jgi:hypothetical protein
VFQIDLVRAMKLRSIGDISRQSTTQIDERQCKKHWQTRCDEVECGRKLPIWMEKKSFLVLSRLVLSRLAFSEDNTRNTRKDERVLYPTTSGVDELR